VPPTPPKAAAAVNPDGAWPSAPIRPDVWWALTTPFVKRHLPQKTNRFRVAFPNFEPEQSIRDALNSCYGELYPYLPLLLDEIVSRQCDRTSLAAPQGAVVVAERISNVPDRNRGERCRVDFFVYHLDGLVVRHHPGETTNEDMKPHEMPNGSTLFLHEDARKYGVGATLHCQPPAWFEQVNSLVPPQHRQHRPAVSRAHVSEINVYDIHQVNWEHVKPILDAIDEEKLPVDVTIGGYFPW